MRVKIGKTWFDPEKQPIMIELDEDDKEFIEAMAPDKTKYCVYPVEMSDYEVDEFMEELKPLKLLKRTS